MRTISVVGDLNIDIIFSGMREAPAFGREINADDCRTGVGGSAANTALMLAAMDCPVKLFSRIGNDDYGGGILKDLKCHGLSTETIIRSKTEATGLTVSLTYPHDRMYVSHAGTVATTRLEDLPEGYLSRGNHLHLTSYFLQKGLQPFIGKLLRDAKEMRMTTSLDPGGDPMDEWDFGALKPYLRYLDWFMPNADEIKAITGTDELEDAIRVFGGEISGIVVKAGEDGAMTLCDGIIENHSVIDVKAIDTTGAGDCFNAGFLYALTTRRSLKEAVALGNECGAKAVASHGLPLYEAENKKTVNNEERKNGRQIEIKR